MTIPDEAVQAAYSAYLKFIEEGGSVPVTAALRVALTAALPFLTGVKVKERVFVVSALAQSKDKTGWRSRIIGAANLDEAVGKGLRAFEASEPSVSFCVPGGIEISTETLATAGILSATDVSAPIPSPRAQALEEAALERSIERWRGMKPSEVMKGSTAQITYALEDARKDILTLYSAISSQPVEDEVDSIEVIPSSGCVFADMGVERPVAEERKFQIGDRLTKNKGSSWTGHVVGFYSIELTPIAYAIESETEKGSVQIYPEAALVACPTPPGASR